MVAVANDVDFGLTEAFASCCGVNLAGFAFCFSLSDQDQGRLPAKTPTLTTSGRMGHPSSLTMLIFGGPRIPLLGVG
jgi:hypothetical protein